MSGAIGGWIIAALGGPLARIAPWIAMLPPAATIKRFAIAATYVAALLVGGYAGGKAFAWWQGDVITAEAARIAAKQQCDLTLKAAEVAAKEKALASRDAAIKRREAAVQSDAEAIAQLEAKLEAERENSSSPNRPVLGADDKWLRSWRGR